MVGNLSFLVRIVKMIVLVFLVCTVATVSCSEWPIHPGVGAIYKGPNSETIIEGPDGSVITSKHEGGAVETENETPVQTLAETPIVVEEVHAVEPLPEIPEKIEAIIAIIPPEEEEASVELNGPSGVIKTKGSKAVIAGPASTTFTGPEVGGRVVEVAAVPLPVHVAAPAVTPDARLPLGAYIAVDGLSGNRQTANQLVSTTLSPEILSLPVTNTWQSFRLAAPSPLPPITVPEAIIRSSSLAPQLLGVPAAPEIANPAYLLSKEISAPSEVNVPISSTLTPSVEISSGNIHLANLQENVQLGSGEPYLVSSTLAPYLEASNKNILAGVSGISSTFAPPLADARANPSWRNYQNIVQQQELTKFATGTLSPLVENSLPPLENFAQPQEIAKFSVSSTLAPQLVESDVNSVAPTQGILQFQDTAEFGVSSTLAPPQAVTATNLYNTPNFAFNAETNRNSGLDTFQIQNQNLSPYPVNYQPREGNRRPNPIYVPIPGRQTINVNRNIPVAEIQNFNEGLRLQNVPLHLAPEGAFQNLPQSNSPRLLPNIQSPQQFQSTIREANPRNLPQVENVRLQQNLQPPVNSVSNYAVYSHADLPNTLYRGLALRKL